MIRGMLHRAMFSAALAGLAAGMVTPLQAGSYFASDFEGVVNPEAVFHVHGYDGTGGELTVEICIDPASANKTEMLVSIENALRTLNNLVPTTGNVTFDNNVPGGAVDFESVLLHELGHCLGLGHTNNATESGLGCANASGTATCIDCNNCDRDFTKSIEGPNGVFNLDSGADNVIGTADDQRGDDINLFWFRKSNNNPFTLPATVDSTTYSRLLGDLPGGHDYAATASRCVAKELLGTCDTEAVMKQGTFSGQSQRTLAHDDVATLRYARSGVDELAGTGDEYTWTVEFIGEASNCDIVISMEAIAGLAFCESGFQNFIGTDHWRMAKSPPADNPSVAKFSSTTNWFFNDVSNAECSVDEDLVLDNQTITGTQTFEACQTITATNFTVTSTGDVTFRAGVRITLGEGFHVEQGGKYTTEIDPTIE